MRRTVIVGLAAALAAPAFVIAPAHAAVLFSCASVTGSAVLAPGLVHDSRAQSLSSGPTAPAGPADIRLASTRPSGVKANLSSFGASISGDGSRVAFQTDSYNLVPEDADFNDDIYVKDLETGALVLASTSDAGVKANGNSSSPDLSADGTRVAFVSNSTNLDPADTDGNQDVYVKDLVTDDIVLATTSDTGVKADGRLYPSAATLSADGTRVAFSTLAANLDPGDTDRVYDVYVKNLNTGNIDLVSRSAAGVKGNGPSLGPGSMSADGHVVAFFSNATNLDPDDTDNGRDVYVKDRHTGEITVASTSDTGVNADNVSEAPQLSADGTKVAFSSTADNLDAADTDTIQDVYVKDLVTGDLVLASTSDGGAKGDDVSSPSALAAGGTTVAMVSRATNLDPNDVAAGFDTYVKDLRTGDMTLAPTSDTGVGGNAPTLGGGTLAADGATVAFSSRANNLDPGDPDDDRYDIFVKQLPSTPTSVVISGCSNGNSGTASIVDIRSYGPRPLGCPTSFGGAAGNDYPDTTPILVGGTLSMTIDWASGPNSYGVAAAKAGPTGTQWRLRLAITASPGRDTPATNQYLPAAGSGATKTRLQGKLDVNALDSFDCTGGTADPLSWLDIANNGTWVAKTG
jgi:Tol biopolymer transport system component